MAIRKRSGAAVPWEFDYSAPTMDSTLSASADITPINGNVTRSNTTGDPTTSALDATVESILSDTAPHVNTLKPAQTGGYRRKYTICKRCGNSTGNTSMREHVKRCRPPARIDVGTKVLHGGREFVIVAIDDMPDTYMLVRGVTDDLEFKRDVPARELRTIRNAEPLPDNPPF